MTTIIASEGWFDSKYDGRIVSIRGCNESDLCTECGTKCTIYEEGSVALMNDGYYSLRSLYKVGSVRPGDACVLLSSMAKKSRIGRMKQ